MHNQDLRLHPHNARKKARWSFQGGNQIDTICHPTSNIVFLDAARVHETIIAHELGHAWLQYVDECEDLRVMRDASDPQRLRLLSFVQSFVLDLKVNELIQRKGFDMAPIEADQYASLIQLAKFLSNGGKTDLPREEVIWAMSIAERLLVKDYASSSALTKLDTVLPVIRRHAPTVMALADTMAAAVQRHGYASHEAVIASIDDCLRAAFEHCGDSIDLERELVEVQAEEPNLDKWPEWIGGASVALKTTVGKVMAREDIPSNARWSLSDRGHQTLLHFVLDNGVYTEGWLLDIPFPFRDPLASVRMHMANQRRHAERLERQLAEVDRINCDNRERQEQMLRHAGVHLPAMPLNRSLPVAPGHRASNNAEPRPNGLGEPLGKRVPELLPTSRSGSIPSALVGPGLLSLPTSTRHYMAGLGRFLTAVRLHEQLEGEHPYGYALNNPVTYTDPSGLQVAKLPKNPESKWSQPPFVHSNNCYFYAIDVMRPGPGIRDWPNPGGPGCMDDACSCKKLIECIARDGYMEPRPKGKKCPAGTYTVIAFVKPTPPCDYHFARSLPNGRWCDKHGNFPVCTPFDDPYEHNRRLGYTVVCQHYCVRSKS